MKNNSLIKLLVVLTLSTGCPIKTYGILPAKQYLLCESPKDKKNKTDKVKSYAKKNPFTTVLYSFAGLRLIAYYKGHKTINFILKKIGNAVSTIGDWATRIRSKFAIKA